MNPFWTGFFQQFKDCGRGTLSFFLGLITLFGLLLGAVLADKINVSPSVLTGVTLFILLWTALLIRRAWKRRRQRLNFSPLSSDEMVKARSKLKNGFVPTNQFKPVRFQRPPDTDLRF